MSKVNLKIDGKEFEFWNSFELTRSIGSSDTFSFDAPFDFENLEFRKTFRPLSFQPVEVDIDGSRELTGIAVGISPSSAPNASRVNVSGYSKAGVLSDCQIPSGQYPIEYFNLNFAQIAEKVCAPFGLSINQGANVGQPFEQVGADVSEKALSFLASLAKERGLVLSSDGLGRLLMQKANTTGSPVAVITDGEAGVSGVSMASDAQKIFSDVTSLGPTVVGLSADKYTANNARVDSVRPLVVKTDGASQGDVKTDAESKIGRMYGDALSWSVNIVGWNDPSGALWRPNTIVSLLAPNAMIYSRFNFLIKSVSLRQADSSETATLSLVLPESYSSKVPESLPWE